MIMKFVCPIPVGGSLTGFTLRNVARQLANDGAQITLGHDGYQFYRNPENWHLLPTNLEIKIILFCDACFEIRRFTFAHYLFRSSAGWSEGEFGCMGSPFYSNTVVAVSDVLNPVT
jgi:hypothetical protein